MRRISSLLLALVMFVGICACAPVEKVKAADRKKLPRPRTLVEQRVDWNRATKPKYIA